MAETMTDHTKTAGEVEARKAALAALGQFPVLDGRIIQLHANAAIDAYLAKLTPAKPEPSRIADTRVEKITAMQTFCDTKYPEQICKCASSDCGECNTRYLLSHITAIEAELTAQKAAHAKLLRDEAARCMGSGDKTEKWAAYRLQLIAAKIEGEP